MDNAFHMLELETLLSHRLNYLSLNTILLFHIPSPVCFLRRMKRLSFSNVNLTAIPGSRFRKMSYLKSVAASGNGIDRIEYGTFAGLDQLEKN